MACRPKEDCAQSNLVGSHQPLRAFQQSQKASKGDEHLGKRLTTPSSCPMLAWLPLAAAIGPDVSELEFGAAAGLVGVPGKHMPIHIASIRSRYKPTI